VQSKSMKWLPVRHCAAIMQMRRPLRPLCVAGHFHRPGTRCRCGVNKLLVVIFMSTAASAVRDAPNTTAAVVVRCPRRGHSRCSVQNSWTVHVQPHATHRSLHASTRRSASIAVASCPSFKPNAGFDTNSLACVPR
jgi:hypothetical protein